MLLCADHGFAADVFSTGNASNQKFLPVHLPMIFVLHASPDAPWALSKRDANLANYAHKSVTLPGAQDASSLFARDLALQSLSNMQVQQRLSTPRHCVDSTREHRLLILVLAIGLFISFKPDELLFHLIVAPKMQTPLPS